MQARARRVTAAKLPNLSVEDLMLAAMVIELPNHLLLQWQVPKRVMHAITDWIFEIEDWNELHTNNPPRFLIARGDRGSAAAVR